MARYSNVQSDFSGGLISDYILGRLDIKRVANSARVFKNFFPSLQGPAVFRSGTKWYGSTTASQDKVVTVDLVLATDSTYRAEFTSNVIKVYDANGNQLGSTVNSPYNSSQLEELRFSAESDGLYIAHPLHKPKLLKADITTESKELVADDGGVLKNLTALDVNGVTRTLTASAQVFGDTSWSLVDLEFTVDPISTTEESNSKYSISQNERYLKIESSANDFSILTGTPLISTWVNSGFETFTPSNGNATISVANTANNSYMWQPLSKTYTAGEVIKLTLNASAISGSFTLGLTASDSSTLQTATPTSNAIALGDNTYQLTVDAGQTATHVFIQASGATSATFNNLTEAVSNATDFYVEYELEGEKLLGKVVDAATSANYTLEDPTNNTVYIEPVESVVDIQDPAAQLFLLDAEETTDVDEIAALGYDGVPDDSIHVRCDTTVFNQGYEGSWIRVGSDRRNNNVVVGHTRSLTRWLKIKEHRGTEDHPVDFFRGVTTNDDYTFGSVYRFYIMNPTQLWMAGVDSVGEVKVTTGYVNQTGNRSATFNQGWSTTRLHGNTSHFTPYSGNAADVIGNLSTQKNFDVVECYNFADDGVPLVEEYNASNNTDGKLIVPPSSSVLTVTTIANDATLRSTNNEFTDADVGRCFMGTLPSGNVYMRGYRRINAKDLKVELINAVPRDKRTLDFENNGEFQSFRKGAWYNDNYPRTVTKFEQRRIYGGTFAEPNFLFFSRTDDTLSFQLTQDDGDVLDTDAITYELSNRTAGVRWLNAANELVIGTSGGIYRVVPNQYQFGISPKTVRIELSEEEPCNAQAETIGSSVFYPDRSGTRLLEYKYDTNLTRGSSNDVSKLIYPTFVNDSIAQIAYQHSPQPRIWTRTVSGKLYSLSYHRQEEFYAWAEHDLGANATVLDINVTHGNTSSDLDKLWMTVKRTDAGSGTQVYYEALADDESAQSANYYHLDSFLELKRETGVLSLDVSSRFSENDVVTVVVDGQSEGTQTVPASGLITINNPTTAQQVLVGLAYEGELKMMFPTWDGQNKPAYGSDNARVISIKPFFINSFSYSVGVKSDITKNDLSSSYGIGNGFTGFDKERPVSGSTFGVDNVPTIKHSEPYPLTIASITTKTDLN